MPPPTGATRAAFDQKTAAINVTPSQSGGYDLSEIKNDALWLSKEAQVEEIQALRVVIVELNSRSVNRLLDGINSTEGAFFPQDQKDGVAAGQAQQEIKRGKEASQDHERRQTLLQRFLHERKYLSAVAQLVVAMALHSDSFEAKAGRPRRANSVPSVVEDCGNDVVKAWEFDSSSPRRHFVLRAAEFFESRLRHLNQPAGWLQGDQVSEELEILRRQTLLTEMIHVLQAVFTFLDWSSDTPPAEVLDSWFRLMDMCQFLSFLETADYPETSELSTLAKSLVAVVSLAIIKLPNLTLALSQAAGQAPSNNEPPGDTAAYFRNVECVEGVTSCFLQAIETGALTAGPGALAWSIAFQDVADYSNAIKESREVRQAQQVTDRLEADHQADIDGGRHTSPSRRSSMSSETSQQLSLFEEVTNAITNLRPNDQLLRTLASDSINNLGALDVVKGLSEEFCADISPDRYGDLGLRIRLLFLQLLQATQDILGYQTSTVECCLAVLNGRDNYWDRFDRPPQVSALEPARAFLKDLPFKTRMWTYALGRFPYETLPVLKLCQALCVPAQSMQAELEESLENMKLFAIVQNEREGPL